MVVRVLSKREFDNRMKKFDINDDNVEEQKGIFISIVDFGDKSYFKSDHSNVLRLEFHDLSDIQYNESTNKKDLILFSPEHAKQIVDFIQDKKDYEYCFVHCHAGISRSGAVGTVINDVMGEENFFTFSSNNPWIHSNAYILAELRKAFNEQ